MHATGGIRTHSFSKRGTADPVATVITDTNANDNTTTNISIKYFFLISGRILPTLPKNILPIFVKEFDSPSCVLLIPSKVITNMTTTHEWTCLHLFSI
jgi:hypothetical protein